MLRLLGNVLCDQKAHICNVVPSTAVYSLQLEKSKMAMLSDKIMGEFPGIFPDYSLLKQSWGSS